ncbi:MAG: preprotein translocase subunit SecD [Pseudomonadota bacterium]|nr:preprotein translocase subunit SecD [Pseudomonadota bacterium]
MINQYPLWKYLLLVVVVIVGVLYAAPNLYGEDPSVLISNRITAIDEATVANLESQLKSQAIPYNSVETSEGRILIRFASADEQLLAIDKIKTMDLFAGNRNYTVALNLTPATPAWLRSIRATPMYLGLDLRGGVHFLMEVDMDAAIKHLEDVIESDMRTYLRDKKVRYLGITRDNNGIQAKFRDLESMQQGLEVLKREFRDLEFIADETTFVINVRLTEVVIRNEKRSAIQQNVTTLRNRINELGVTEPVIQQQGDSRIVVQLPGVQDTARAKEILGATATLEFRLTEGSNDDAWREAEQTGRVPLNARLYHSREGRPVLLKRDVIVTGDQINNASSTIDPQSGTPAVSVTLDGKGAKKMADITRENINKPMAVVFIENKVETKVVDGAEVKTRSRTEEVINVATIRDAFGKQFQITGLGSAEARDLALLLRAGALSAPVEIIEERTVGPTLGAENIQRGFHSTWLGFALIAVFMIVYYMMFGVTAVIALGVNVILLVALLSALQATLTLPGMAAIALTVGMAIDANVLINERIREELRNGNSPQASIHAGYERAFGTIIDSNITTLVAGVALFLLGSGPVRGFAVVLCLGIITSMFSGVMVSRALVNLIYGSRRKLETLAIGNTVWK